MFDNITIPHIPLAVKPFLARNTLKPTQTLSHEQCLAIEYPGALLVTAGAGSGKTTVLAKRIAHLIINGSCDPFQMLVVTFSVKASRELRDRLEQLLPANQVRPMTVCTLHALGLRMLREYGDVLGFDCDGSRRKPRVLTAQESRPLLNRAISDTATELAETHPMSSRLLARMTIDETASHLSIIKASEQASDGLRQTNAPVHVALTAVLSAYQRQLLAANAVDFDDLIYLPLQLLRQHPDALSFYQARWTHVLVDEFQDVSAAQYELVKTLASTSHNLTVIGDPLQCIFGFRGALGGDGFERFRRDFAEAKVLYLPHNYRSSANIVALGDALLGKAKPSQLAVKATGLPICLLRTSSEHEEANLVARELSRAVISGFACYDDCAVLCRTNAQVNHVEKALLDANVPYTVVGRGNFFEQITVRDILAYLSLSQDVLSDDFALRQIVDTPARQLGLAEQQLLRGNDPELTVAHLLDAERVSKLSDEAQISVQGLLSGLNALSNHKDGAPSDLIAFILSDDDTVASGLGYQRWLTTKPDATERLEHVQALMRMAQTHDSVATFLDEIDVMSGQDPLSSAGHERVQLLTLHDSKGLEYKLVFLIGLEEHVLPHHHSQDSQRTLEEERRLCYVGFTRATDALCMSYARTRNGHPTSPSRFLQGLPAHLFSRQPLTWVAK